MVSENHPDIFLLKHPPQRADAAVAVSVNHIAQNNQVILIGEVRAVEEPQKIRQWIAVQIGSDIDHGRYLQSVGKEKE